MYMYCAREPRLRARAWDREIEQSTSVQGHGDIVIAWSYHCNGATWARFYCRILVPEEEVWYVTCWYDARNEFRRKFVPEGVVS